MRAFGIVAVLIALLVAIFLVSRDFTSRTAKTEEKSKITAIEKAKDAERKIEQSNEATRKIIKQIQDD